MFADPVFVRRSARLRRRVPTVLRRPCAAGLAAALILGGAPLPLTAQQLPEGLGSSAVAVATTISHAHVTSAGLVTFDGTTLALEATGLPPQTLLTLASPFFGSFVLQTSATHVLLGYTGFAPFGANDAIWHVPLQGPPPAQPLATVPFNYDAVMLTTTTVLLSARTGGFGAADNELLVLDLTTGATQLVASITGASGPVAIAPNGDVFYATGFAGWPPVAGTVQVLRFPRPQFDQAILAGTVLGLPDALVVMAGLDAASDMVFDDDGDLLFTDWFNLRVSEVSNVDGVPFLVPTIVDYAGASVSAGTLQFEAGNAHGVFEPFQPAHGSLLVHESDFVATSRVRRVRAAPATLSATGGTTIGAGPFDFVTSGGPSNGIGVLAFTFGAALGHSPVTIPGFEQPVWLDLVLANTPVLVTVLFDGTGSTILSPTNPGFSPALTATAQVVFVSTTGVLGATAALQIQLGP